MFLRRLLDIHNVQDMSKRHFVFLLSVNTMFFGRLSDLHNIMFLERLSDPHDIMFFGRLSDPITYKRHTKKRFFFKLFQSDSYP